MQGKHFATIGMLLGALALMVAGLDHWADAVKPQFVAGVLTAVGAVLKGMYDDKPDSASSVGAFKVPTILLAVSLGAAMLTLPACAGHQAPNTAPASDAQKAAAVLQRIDELQNAVISANQLTPGSIPDSVAVPLVKFCVESAKVLQASPNGVLPAIAEEWRSLKLQIPPQYRQLPAVTAAFVAVDIALAEVGVEPAAVPAPAATDSVTTAPASRIKARLKEVGYGAAALGVVLVCAYGGNCGFMGGGQ